MLTVPSALLGSRFVKTLSKAPLAIYTGHALRARLSSPAERSPVDYHRDEKFRELKRLRFDDDDFPRDCLRLIRFLAVMTIRDPKRVIRQATVCKYLYGVPGEFFEVTGSHLGQLNRLRTKTIDELEKAYDRPLSKLSAYRICLGQGDRSEGMVLKFKRRRYTTANTPPPITSPSGSRNALFLWERMVAATANERVFLLFDTPLLGLPDSVMDQRGLWAGSGEVSGAYVLGQHLSQLNRRVRLKRWRDLNHPELTGKHTA